MEKIEKYVGLDVQKDSITIAFADEGRDGDVRVYGKIVSLHRAGELTAVYVPDQELDRTVE